MQKVSHTIRVDAEDLKRWKQASVSAGIKSLSEWMRRVLNKACVRPASRVGYVHVEGR